MVTKKKKMAAHQDASLEKCCQQNLYFHVVQSDWLVLGSCTAHCVFSAVTKMYNILNFSFTPLYMNHV